MKKEPKLSSVVLKDKGLKGVEVTYAQQKIKQNRSFINEIKEKSKQPIHQELETCFSWLKPDMLKICGYNHEDQSLLSALEMTAIYYNDKGFVLAGDLSVWTGIIKLETPLIEDGNQYEDFGKVASILDGIYAETNEYLSGNKSMDDTQLVMRFNEGKEGFDAEAFKKLPKEEQKALATKILEDSGCIVLHNDDFEEETQEPFSFEVMEKPKAIQAELEIPKSVPEKASTIIMEEGGGFSLNIPAEPVKASTAKRKAV